MAGKHRTDEELIALGRALRVRGGARRILLREFAQQTGVSDATIRRRFGSWDQFSQQFQGEPSPRSATRSETTPEPEAHAVKVHQMRQQAKDARILSAAIGSQAIAPKRGFYTGMP